MRPVDTKQVCLTHLPKKGESGWLTERAPSSYKFSHLSYIRSALSYSTKASLRTDSSGVLSMQFMIVNVAGTDEAAGAGFVELTLMPLNEED